MLRTSGCVDGVIFLHFINPLAACRYTTATSLQRLSYEAATRKRVPWNSSLFHRRTRACYVYNERLACYNVVLTPWIHSSVKFVGLPLATRATVE